MRFVSELQAYRMRDRGDDVLEAHVGDDVRYYTSEDDEPFFGGCGTCACYNVSAALPACTKGHVPFSTRPIGQCWERRC